MYSKCVTASGMGTSVSPLGAASLSKSAAERWFLENLGDDTTMADEASRLGVRVL